MPNEALLLQDKSGNTALTLAAIAGDIKAVTILVNRNPDLVYVRDNDNALPLVDAARYSNRQIISYLLNVVSNNIKSYPNPFGHKSDGLLLNDAIGAKYFDIAVELVEKYPHLATLKVEGYLSPLEAIARIPSAFRRGSKLKYWESLVYDSIPLSLLECHPNKNEGDVENATRNSDQVLTRANRWNYSRLTSVMWQELQIMIWKTIVYLAPPIEQIKDKKQMHNHALQLVKMICKRIETLNTIQDQRTHYGNAVTRAAMLDNAEVIEEIVEIFPNAIWFFTDNKDRHYMIHLAVINRSENVFNLAYQMDGNKHRVMNLVDSYKNTILHLVGRLAKPQKLNLVSGAALQMQRELQWFKRLLQCQEVTNRTMDNQFYLKEMHSSSLLSQMQYLFSHLPPPF
ncbi:hypothetical protein NMG60_11029571 [Bertholletia excelsa]